MKKKKKLKPVKAVRTRIVVDKDKVTPEVWARVQRAAHGVRGARLHLKFRKEDVEHWRERAKHEAGGNFTAWIEQRLNHALSPTEARDLLAAVTNGRTTFLAHGRIMNLISDIESEPVKVSGRPLK